MGVDPGGKTAWGKEGERRGMEEELEKGPRSGSGMRPAGRVPYFLKYSTHSNETNQ